MHDIYRQQRNVGKVMFLHLSVILFTGGVSVPAYTIGHMTRGVSVQGCLCLRVSVQGGLCLGGLCSEGSLSGGSLSRGSLSRESLSGGSLSGGGVSVMETLPSQTETPIR